MMTGLKIEQVSKTYGHKTILNDISIHFEKNKIYSLLGRNGAGKSTLIKMIGGYIPANQGEFYLEDINLKQNDVALSKIFIMNSENYYPAKMKVKDIFKWTKVFYPEFNLERAYDYAELFQLNVKSKFKALSTGYNSILKIIIALNINMPYVIYDEPILGLDANHRELFYKLLLQGYEENPHTIIIATHLIEEIANIIEHVVIIENGHVLIDDEIENILNRGYSISGDEKLVENFIKDKQVLDVDSLAGFKVAYILGELDQSTIPETLKVDQLSLQKFFVKLTERGGL